MLEDVGKSVFKLLDVRIRAAKPADAVGILEIYAPFVRTPVTFEAQAPGVPEMRKRIADYSRRYAWLVCEDERGLLGYAYGSDHRSRAAYRWCAETSIYVAARARRKGVARALYRRLFAELKRRGLHNLYAGIALPNKASVAFHEALGFKLIGVYKAVGYKLGRWHDVGWWQLRINRPRAPRRLPATGA